MSERSELHAPTYAIQLEGDARAFISFEKKSPDEPTPDPPSLIRHGGKVYSRCRECSMRARTQRAQMGYDDSVMQHVIYHVAPVLTASFSPPERAAEIAEAR